MQPTTDLRAPQSTGLSPEAQELASRQMPLNERRFDASVTAMQRVLANVHDSYLAEFDDDLDAVLGAPAGPEWIAGSHRPPGLMRRRPGASPVQDLVDSAELPCLAERLDRLLGQLVNMARAAHRCSSPGFGAAIDRADRLRSGPAAAATADVVQVRRMAMAAQDLLDHLDSGDTGPLPTFEPSSQGLWCA